MRLAFGALAALLLAAAPAMGQVAKSSQCEGSPARDLYRICFDGDGWLVDEPTNVRFTNRDRVEVEVQHFNFLRYTLSFDVKEEKSESYQYLTKLWTSLLDPNVMNLLALGGEKKAVDSLASALRDVHRRVQALDSRVTSLTGAYKNVGLTKDQAGSLKVAVFGPGKTACPATGNDEQNMPDFPAGTEDPLTLCTVGEILRGLNTSYSRLSRLLLIDDTTFVDALTGERKSLYLLVSKEYSDVRKRADTFMTLAGKTVSVETKKAGKHEAGTRVTLTLSALDEGGARTPVADVNYFVETTMPLVVHGGLAFSGLRDVTFEKVKRASAFGEEDLFAKKSDDASSKNFSAFLSWTLTPLAKNSGPGNAVAALLLSIGTDVAAPGKKIFVGPSILLFGRMGLTVGAALSKEEKGEIATLEPDVFRIVRAHPKASFFFSLTSKVH